MIKRLALILCLLATPSYAQFITNQGSGGGGGGSGTVTSVAVTAQNGVSAVVTNPTTTPDLAFTLGAITPSSISTGGQITSTLAIGTAPLVITSTTLVPNLYVARAAVADSATTNANLTGPITSVGNATSIASQTGTGTKFVVDTSPTLVTPNIGVATGTSLALNGATIGSNAAAGIGQFASYGATTTGPGFYAYLNGDTLARVRIGLDANDMPSLAFGAGGASARDTFILRAAAASLQFGQTDVDAAPVAQTIRTQGTLAGGTSNVAGANWTFIASPGKGTGVGGSFLFQTAPAGSTGTTVNAPVTALTIDSTQRATFSAGITNSGNGAASIAQSLWNGTVLTGSTATTNFPAMLVQPSGTSAVTSWSTSGTGLGMNLASGFAGNFLDFHVAGAGTAFNVTSAGAVNATSAGITNGIIAGANIQAGAASFFVLNGRSALGSPADGSFTLSNNGTTAQSFLSIPASATLQFGRLDVASGAIAQTLTFQGNTGSTTNGPLALIRGAGGGSSTAVGGELRLSGGLSSAAAGTGGAVTVYTAPAANGATAALVATFAANGQLAIATATDSSSTVTGSIITAGGIGVAKTIGAANLQLANTGNNGWVNRSQIASPADGQVTLYNNAFTDFSRLQFGGITSSFPALKRSTTSLQVRLADDSADAGLSMSTLTASGISQITNATDASASSGSGSFQVAGGASVAKRFWIPAITTSSGLQTAVLCQSSGGEMIADSVACLASSARFKDIRGPLSSDIVGKFMRLPIKVWAYKEEGIFKNGNWTRDRIGPIAEDVEKLDPRLVEYDKDGQVRAYSTEQLLAYTIKVVQEQQHQIDSLSARLRNHK